MNILTTKEETLTPHRRIEDKIDAIVVVQDQHTEQLNRIETNFHDHVVRQSSLMIDIKTTLNNFITGIEDTISREVNKITKR